jgi:alpha,alpha-trehalose-phosphate synthase [UDP-forming]
MTEPSFHPLVVLSNRGPQRRRQGTWVRSTGGLVTALDPVVRDRGGVWVSTCEDEDAGDPPDAGYRQALVRLPTGCHTRFYSDVANGVLWPTLHGFPTIARLTHAPWDAYETANAAFADAAAGLTADDGLVWVHDYHLMLAPARLRQRRPRLRIGWFCHVPWPSADQFAVLPWSRQVLMGLLGADVVGFHTAHYAERFLDCVEDLSGVRVDRERGVIEAPRGRTQVAVAPIGIPLETIAQRVGGGQVRARAREIRKAVGSRRIILGVDRLDYTKGIPERLTAYGRLLERQPHLREKVVLVQVVVPSRESVPAYADLRGEIDRRVGYLNGRFGCTGQVAVHYLYRRLDPIELFAHYCAADVALVTPLQDGMNLVALEFVASRTQEDGALVLSEFAGAAERLQHAFLVNPYDIDSIATQLEVALQASAEELHRRMRLLRSAVASLDVHAWATHFLSAVQAVGAWRRPRPRRMTSTPARTAARVLAGALTRGRAP